MRSNPHRMEWPMSSSVRLQFARKSSPVPKYCWWVAFILTSPRRFLLELGAKGLPSNGQTSCYGVIFVDGGKGLTSDYSMKVFVGPGTVNRDVKWAGPQAGLALPRYVRARSALPDDGLGGNQGQARIELHKGGVRAKAHGAQPTDSKSCWTLRSHGGLAIFFKSRWALWRAQPLSSFKLDLKHSLHLIETHKLN